MSSYNREDILSIIQFAQQLVGKPLREVCNPEIINHGYSGKGNFGQILEDYYFKYKPNSDSRADFHEVGLEVKSTALKKLKNNELRAKERLVLNMINYNDLVSQDFETSTFFEKNAHLLLIFYLYERGVNILDLIVKLVGEWKFPETDLEIIRKDWELIKSKVISGKAHELSEGDTVYLGACTKGGKGGNPRSQPYSSILAKQRAFSFKQGYLNYIIDFLRNTTFDNDINIIDDKSLLVEKSFEEIVLEKFQPYIGITFEKIAQQVDFVAVFSQPKSMYSLLTNAILGLKNRGEFVEFKKAGIQIKTVRLSSENMPREDISFPAFEYLELIEEEWEESELLGYLESKFLFVFYKEIDNGLVLDKVKFWNMPQSDIEEAKKVWEHTIQLIKAGNIVKSIQNGIRRTNFSGSKGNRVLHVRPHAKDSTDTYPLPVFDTVSGLSEYTKQSFWFNKKYIKESIYYK